MVRNIRGALIGIGANGILGWAYDSNSPGESLKINFFVDGVLAGTTFSHPFDEGRVNDGVPGAESNFRGKLDFVPKSVPPFYIRAQIEGTEHELANPIYIATYEDLRAVVTGAETARYRSSIDGVKDGCVHGWVCDLDFPARLQVELIDGTKVLASCTADQFRGDVSTHLGTDGYHGFTLPLSMDLLDGATHMLNVRVAKSAYYLSNGPIGFGVTQINDIVSHVQQVRDSIAASNELLERTIESFEKRFELEKQALFQRVDAVLLLFRDQIEAEFAVELDRLLDEIRNNLNNK